MPIRKSFVLSTLLGFTSLVAAEGLAVRDPGAAWPQWQARLSLLTGAATTTGYRITPDDGAQPFGGARAGILGGALLGDYYLRAWTPGWLSRHGALRATSGLMVGTRSLAVADVLSSARGASRVSLAVQAAPPALGNGAGPAEGLGTAPYLGIGYTGLSLKGGWGFTADLGVTAENQAGAWRVGGARLGTQGFESALRELRLSPLLQLGVSYSF